MLRSLLVLLLSLPLAFVQAGAQSITGYSSIQDTFVRVPIFPKCPPPPHPCADFVASKEVPVASVYSDTEEDYTASLYYNVETANSLFYENTSINSQDSSGNPSQSLTYKHGYPAGGDGIYSETTAHLLDFFYITSIGEYYDPFGYSATNGDGDGNWDSGFWFYVNAYGQYITEASVLLGETYSVINHNSPIQPGSSSNGNNFSVLYQAYIPFQWVYGPPNLTCLNPNTVYMGDNRGPSPSLGSYRAFQQITLGVGSVISSAGEGTEDTGFTRRYAQDSLTSTDSSGQFTQAALQDVVTGDCHYLEAVGKAGTGPMIVPTARYSGGSVSTSFAGDAANPVAYPSFAITWDANVQLTSVPGSVLVSGSIVHDCFPSHEISVGGHDVYSYTPTRQDTPYLTFCLGGGGQISSPINYSIPVAP